MPTLFQKRALNVNGDLAHPHACDQCIVLPFKNACAVKAGLVIDEETFQRQVPVVVFFDVSDDIRSLTECHFDVSHGLDLRRKHGHAIFFDFAAKRFRKAEGR